MKTQVVRFGAIALGVGAMALAGVANADAMASGAMSSGAMSSSSMMAKHHVHHMAKPMKMKAKAPMASGAMSSRRHVQQLSHGRHPLACQPLATPPAGRAFGANGRYERCRDNPCAERAGPTKGRREVVYRHRLVTRITHWVNVLCVSLLLMSGLQIFNAHPALYWGQYGADADRPFIEFVARGDGRAQVGETRIGGLTLATTGLLGASRAPDGGLEARGFPSWITLPSYQDLATGRRWHFFFAWLFAINGLVYLAAGLVSGHFRRDLTPTLPELRPGHILKDILEPCAAEVPDR